MSPEPGSDEGVNGNGAGGGSGGHSERSDDGRMSLLHEEDYGKQTRVLKVCFHHLLSPIYFFFPSLLSPRLFLSLLRVMLFLTFFGSVNCL
jgi:hypothetical protein